MQNNETLYIVLELKKNAQYIANLLKDNEFKSCCDHHAPGRQKCLPGFFLPYRYTWKDVNLMAKFISREKLSKKARKELDNQKRAVWAFSPTTRKVESKKLYNRRKSAHAWKNDFGISAFCLV